MSPACAEKWERVGEDAGERLQIPCQRALEEECCHLLACDVDVILEKELQRQPSQHQRLRQRRGENAEDDDKPQREQIVLGGFCPRATGRSGFAHSGFICILSFNRIQEVDWANASFLWPKIESTRAGALPNSALAKACDYTVTRWNRLSRFLEYPNWN